MIAMLKRPEGATVEQIAEAMGWARHTVRGPMAGALKKKLGLTITSEKIAAAASTGLSNDADTVSGSAPALRLDTRRAWPRAAHASLFCRAARSRP